MSQRAVAVLRIILATIFVAYILGLALLWQPSTAERQAHPAAPNVVRLGTISVITLSLLGVFAWGMAWWVRRLRARPLAWIKPVTPEATVAAMMANAYARRNGRPSYFAAVAFGLVAVVAFRVPTAALMLTAIIVGAGFVALATAHALVEYRLSAGVYGSNEHEARQLLDFVLRYERPDDFMSGGWPKEIFADNTITPAESTVAIGEV